MYRYGGEEFIVILNRTTLQEATSSVERIIKEVEQSRLLYKGHNINLTISAGIGCYKKGDTPEMLIEKADSSLYKAKSNGKNCLKVDC